MPARSLPFCLRLALPVAAMLALVVGAPPAATPAQEPSAELAGSVKKPRPVERSTQRTKRVKATSVKRATLAKRANKAKKRPIKSKPLKRTAAPSKAQVATPTAPNDPLLSGSWSLTKTNAAVAWNTTSGRAEIVVAVLDTGIDASHPDLAGSFVAGYDVVNRDEDPADDHGHGTMVAGVIAARANNGLGGVGACSRCSLMPVKVIAANGSGAAADVAEGIRWATNHGAHVINMSFTLSGADGNVAQAIDEARGRGVLVVAAAGNAGSVDATFPASHPGVVSVAGTDSGDARYGWSSFGSWVRLAAPGCSTTTAPGAGYGDFCGTSSAAAFVSGVAGLVRSVAPGLSPDAVEQALTANALPVGDFVSTGRIDAGRAIQSLPTS